MKKGGSSLFEKLIIPVIIILAIGLAFLLVAKKKVITLLTGLTTLDTPSTTMNIVILICVVAVALFLFYRYKK